jgi:hypothetical protein
VSPVKYELGFYIPEDDILLSHRRENLKSYIPVAISLLTTRQHRLNVLSPHAIQKQEYSTQICKRVATGNTGNGWPVSPARRQKLDHSFGLS